MQTWCKGPCDAYTYEMKHKGSVVSFFETLWKARLLKQKVCMFCPVQKKHTVEGVGKLLMSPEVAYATIDLYVWDCARKKKT